MTTRRTLISLISTLATLAITTTVATAESVKIRYAAFPCTHCAQGWLMPEFGKKYGLDVELVTMKRYSDVQLALATDQVDFGNFGFVNVPLMAEKGIDNVKVIAGVSEGGQGLTIRKGLKITGWKDLEGKRIGSPPNSLIENLFKSSMKHFGADPGKVKFVSFMTMGPEVLQSLDRGDIDGFLGWEPTMAKAALEGIGEYVGLKLEEGPAGVINGALGASTAFVQQHPKATLNVVKAHVEITNYLNNNRDAWRDLAMRVAGTDAKTTDLGISNSVLTYRIPERQIKELAKLLSSAGLTKKNHSGEVHDYIDYSFVVKATGKSANELGSE